MSKQAIIDKIINDAKVKSDSFKEEQTAVADGIIAAAAEECKEYFYRSSAQTDAMAEELEERAQTVAELDAKKILLAARQQVLDDIFSATLKKLKTLDVKTRKKLLLAMLEYAEDGDTVTVAASDATALTQADVKKFADSKGIALSYSVSEAVNGGMVLSGGGVDKNFAFDVEVEQLREEYETSIAKEIFG